VRRKMCGRLKREVLSYMSLCCRWFEVGRNFCSSCLKFVSQWKRYQQLVQCVVAQSTIRNVGSISVQNVRHSHRYDEVSNKIKTCSVCQSQMQSFISTQTSLANSLEYLTFNNRIQRKYMRRRLHLHMPWANLTLYQKIVYCAGVEISDGLSKYISDSVKEENNL